MEVVVHRFVIAALCAAVICVPVAAKAADFSGKWTVAGTMSTPGGGMTIAPVCTFKQDASGALTGSCKGPSYLGSIDGAVDGDTIVWHWHGVATGDDQAPNVTATFKGTLGSDGIIRGNWTDTLVPEGASGIFTAQPVK
jgi:hypothetical protein